MLLVQSCDEAVLIENGKMNEIEKIDYAIPGTLVVFEWDMKKPLDVTRVYENWPKTEDTDDDFF